MRFWIGDKKGGGKASEETHEWDSVKKELKSLTLCIDGQKISLPENLEYVQGKTASANLDGKDVQIESRFLGFKLGNNIVKVRVDEKTKNINIEIE